MMQTAILGWDIGGAHVKAALLNSDGEVVCVLQQPCPLWKGLTYMEQAVDKILAALPTPCSVHAVTMTGELVDCFASREQGVMAIIQTLQAKLGSAQIDVFAGMQGFFPANKVQATEVMAIASANWIASVQLAAKRQSQALFVDIGSTTTDILLIAAHQLQAVGLTDYARLVSGELLYTGIVRTAVMAVTQRAEFNGRSMGLMAEYFATMADVYRVTGELQEQHDQSDTADGAEKTAEASAIRLSRMTGYEFIAEDWPLWRAFAHTLKQQQLANIKQACMQQLQRSMQPEQTCIVGAGVGRFLAKQLAVELNLPYVDFSELIRQTASLSTLDAADCAPAVAVAYLAGGFG